METFRNETQPHATNRAARLFRAEAADMLGINYFTMYRLIQRQN